MVNERQLYKAAWGLCAPQLMPGERHPLRDGRQLSAVLLDARGNSFLATGDDWEGEYVFAPRRLHPETRLSLVRKSEDSFVVQFEAVTKGTLTRSTPARGIPSKGIPAKGKHWFRWRLDGGVWSAPQSTSLVSLNFVPAGSHRIEAAAINARLQLDPTPAVKAFRVDITPQAQLAKFLTMLRSSDYTQREAAVKALAQQPERALPALRTARAGADADLRWWIDAAIQESESRRKSP